MKKATDKELIESYKQTKSVWKTAKTFGMCGQSVYERLHKINIVKKINILTDREKDLIKTFYELDIKRGDGYLKELSKHINRTIPSMSRS